MDILKSLTQISTDYTFFEQDQVLTHNQLNSITDYLDDQNRLTRVNLLGVGIACGLRVSLQGDTVKVSKGVGVTTDGDLLYVKHDTVFDKFKLYDKSKPAYAPFYVNGDVTGEMITVYELVRQDTSDVLAISLNQFNVQTGNTLDNMVAVLFMESYKTDRDICSGTDCDNLGQDCINSIKLLLVDKSSTGLLNQDIVTPHQAFSKLTEVVAVRPLITSTDNSPGQLAKIYRNACNAIHSNLSIELSKLYPCSSAFLTDVFSSDPSTEWNTRLNKIKTNFESSDFCIQYYYDFLKDLVETYNHFRELLFGDKTWCCPDLEAFPKHLLLGDLVPVPNPDENHTAFYPSPLVSRTAEQLDHAKFLARKLHTFILTFQVPDSTIILITPSMSEEQPLEERAIPYYYQVNTTYPIHKSWNYRLHQRGMDAYNYSYNATLYGAQGGAANPLTSQISRFSFFRIEGHLGQNVSAVLTSIENEIKTKNLPFTVRSIMLGADKTKVVKEPGIRYTDMHRFHYLLRQDVFHQLDDVTKFNDNFKKDVTDAVEKQIVNNTSDTNDGPTVMEIVDEKHSTVDTNAKAARDKLDRSYSLYKTDMTWIKNLNDTIQAAGEFKYSIGKVVKTEFPTPFDSLISNTHIQWLNWLDEIITKKDDKEDEKLLFSNFLILHPGMEHRAGVVRGGTFVLVYDNNNSVVADFMLPYYCCDIAEEETAEPKLDKPGLRPDLILSKGINVLPSRDKFVTDKLNNFKTDDLEKTINGKIDKFKSDHVDVLWEDIRTNFVSQQKDLDLQRQKLMDLVNTKLEAQQKDYFSTIKESYNLMGSALIGKQVKGGFEGTMPGIFMDADLNQKVKDINEKRWVADYHRKKAIQSDLPADTKKMHEDAAREAETELTDAITKAASYVADKGLDMSPGSEGMAAVMEINKGFEEIKDAQAQKVVLASLEKVRVTSKNTGLNLVLGNMLAIRR